MAHREPPIDLRPHDLAVRCRVVEPAQQRTGEVRAGLVQCGDLLVKRLESLRDNGFPFIDVRGVEDAGDFNEGEARVSEHAYEYKPSEGRDSEAPLTGRPGVGHKKVETFVVADRRGGNARSLGDLPDSKQWLRHAPT